MIVHASAVSIAGTGVLITGPSGAGKSSLALDLMAFGARLVADDRVQLEVRAGALWAAPAPNIAGLIEARGVGILRADALYPACLGLVVDLNAREDERMPPQRRRTWLDIELPCLQKVDSPAFPAAILQYVKGGRAEV